MHQGLTLRKATLKMQAISPPHKAKLHIVSIMVVLTHAVYVVAGHMEGLAHETRSNRRPHTRDAMETFLLEQETRQYRERKQGTAEPR